MFEEKSRQELLDGINAVLSPAKAEEGAPVPSNAPANLTPVQRQVLSDNWIGYLMKSRKPETWTAEEKEGVRLASVQALRTL